MSRVFSGLWMCAWLGYLSGCGGSDRATGPETTDENTPRAEYLAGFADPNLAEAVRQALGKAQGPLGSDDLLKVTQIRAPEYYIKDLGGLERLANLEVLELTKSRLSSLTPLARLVQLRELYLAQNLITDLAPLSALRNLRRLDLMGNQVQEISPLMGLYSLSWVELSGNPLSAFSQDSLLTQLRAQKIEVLFTAVEPYPRRELTGDPKKVKVIFTTYRDGDAEIYGIDAEDGRLVNLTQDPAEDTEAAWAPDGRRFALVSDRSGAAEIYVQELGGIAQPLTSSSVPKSELAWSPDGGYLAYVETLDRRTAVQVVDAVAGTLVWSSDPEVGALSPSWSPDSQRLAYSAYRDGHRALHVVQVADGQIAVLAGATGEVTSPAWSPDGTQIAYVSDQSGDQEVYLIEAGGGQPSDLSRDPGTDVLPSWSPDGTHLALVSDRYGTPEIFLVSRDGSQVERVTHLGVVALSAPVWSGEGSKLLFETNTEGNFEVYILDLSTRKSDNLSLDPAEDVGPRIQSSFQAQDWGTYQVERAAPFADAGLEAAVRAALGNSEESLLRSQLLGIRQLDASQREIANLSGIEQLENLQFLVLAENQVSDLSPLAGLQRLETLDLEGNKVRELAPLAGLAQLQYLNLNFNLVKDLSPLLGLAALRSVELRGNPLDPALSAAQLAALEEKEVQLVLDAPPEEQVAPPPVEPFVFPGPKLAVMVSEKGTAGHTEQYEIYAVSPDGQHQVNLSRETTANDWSPAWSPDGTRLAFSSSRGEFTAPNIYTVELATGDILPLTQGGAYRDPAWSPDGTQLAYVWRGKQLWVMNADGRNPKQLLGGDADIYHLVWSPDGRYIAFYTISVTSGEITGEVFVVDAAGGQAWRADREDGASYFAWHPNSGELLVTSSAKKGAEVMGSLYMVDMDQRRRLLLERKGRIQSVPAWSPDGSRVAFCADVEGGIDLWVLEVQGQVLSNLTQDGQAGYNVAWSPDGAQLAYTVSQPGAFIPDRLMVMDTQGNNRQEIFSRAAQGGGIDEIAWYPKF